MWQKVRIAAAVLLAVYSLAGTPKVPSLSAPKEPTPSMKSAVQPVVRVVSRMSPLDRLWLQQIYSNASKVVAADGTSEPQVISTTEGLRAVHVAILKFIWKGLAENSPGKYAGLSEAIDSVVTETIGDEQKTMSPSLRAKAAEVFDAIAWAGLGKDE